MKDFSCFRPLAGDLSSLQKKETEPSEEKWFPSPCRGLIFLTHKIGSNKLLEKVSVPLQGTYLPYGGCLNASIIKKQFPSPCRGLIFLTCTYNTFESILGFRPLAGDLSSLPRKRGVKRPISFVSVPLQGTYLPYPVRAIHEFPYVSTALCVRKRK